MTDDQYRALSRSILDLAMRMEKLELHLKRQDEMASHRFSLIYEWCAPPQYKQAVDTMSVSIPDDLKKHFG